MYLQQILDAMPAASPRAYNPTFKVRKVPHGYAIDDGETQIAFFGADGWFYLDWWQQSPFGLVLQANEVANPHVRDMHTARHSNINFPWTHALDLFADVENPASCWQLTWGGAGTAELALHIVGDFPREQRLQYVMRLVYDAAWQRYRCFIDIDCWKLSAAGFEPLNMMMVGALHSRPEKRRWTHSVWEDPDGKLRRLVHSNALFEATDYADGARGAQWRTKDGPRRHGWICYAPNADSNPAMLIHENNVPVHFATCSQLFDEHLIWADARHENLDGTLFHFVMHTEFLDLPSALAGELLAAAADPPRLTQWRARSVALPFHMDVVNDLETETDIWAPEACPNLIIGEHIRGVSWVDDVAHSGKHSIRLAATDDHAWTELHPSGAVCNVEQHRRYRFSAWVRTAGVERFARLELASIEYTFANRIDVAHSAKVAGDSDWTQVVVELDSDVEAYMMPRLQLYGRGQAWFDELQFVEV